MAAGGVHLSRVTAVRLHGPSHGELFPRNDMEQVANVLPRLEQLSLGKDAEDLAPLTPLGHVRRIDVAVPSDRVNAPPGVEIIAPPAPRY
jgi:hypothetical protein